MFGKKSVSVFRLRVSWSWQEAKVQIDAILAAEPLVRVLLWLIIAFIATGAIVAVRQAFHKEPALSLKLKKESALRPPRAA